MDNHRIFNFDKLDNKSATSNLQGLNTSAMERIVKKCHFEITVVEY
ncbi:hypothetical protein IGJ18_001633 [Enterococcus sp. AZ078]